MDLDEAARHLNNHPVVEMRSPGEVLALGRRYRRRRTIKMVSGATLAIALVVATTAVALRNSRQHRAITVVATSPTTAPTTAAHRAPNEAEAIRVAALALDEIAVPASAKQWTGAPPSVVASPAQYVVLRPSLMRHRIWSVPVSAGDALHFLQAHPPTGAVPFSYSGGIGSSGPSEEPVRFLQYWGTIHDPAIAELLLNISVANRDPGSSWVRADVQVVYRPERPSDEYVSAHDVVVTISQTSLETRDAHKPPQATVTVTAPAEVRRLRDAVNGVRTKPDGEHWCPALSGREPSYIVAFRRSATSAPDLVATTQQYCDASTGVTVRGKNRPLLEAGDLPTLAAELLQRHASSGH